VKFAIQSLLMMLSVACLLEMTRRESAASPPQPEAASNASGALPSLEVARGQARLLHETIHTTLRMVHHQYYREDERLMLPAAALRHVFAELARRQQVELRWLAVNAHAMNVDHNARTEFEKQAVAALSEGQPSYELADGAAFRHVGAIALTAECLKCHVPNRASTKERIAGLVITIPYQGE
jgi:hypothetical protein